jgi:hypothetical protein
LSRRRLDAIIYFEIPRIEEGVIPMTVSIQADLPKELLVQAEQFVREGWSAGLNELLAESLRRYLEAHTAGLTESFIREDVEWGLHGRT